MSPDSELTAEVGRLAQLVGQANERVSELLAIAQRKKRGDKPAPKPPAPAGRPTALANRPAPSLSNQR